MSAGPYFLDIRFYQHGFYGHRFGQFRSETQLSLNLLDPLTQLLNNGISVAYLFLHLGYFPLLLLKLCQVVRMNSIHGLDRFGVMACLWREMRDRLGSAEGGVLHG